MASIYRVAFLSLGFALICSGAQADLSISNRPTHAMNCSAGVCTAKSANAILNVGDLQTMLAAGDVTVSTSSVANNITIDQPLAWGSASQLALNAQISVIVKKLVTVSGSGSLMITTGSRSEGGEFYVQAKASVQFSDLHSGLVINGQSYQLVADLKSLASAIRKNSLASYAFARPYDATQDGRYKHAPISTSFDGDFEGLGNPISNLTIKDRTDGDQAGLFSNASGNLNDVVLLNESVSATGSSSIAGGLAAAALRLVSRCFTSGKVFATAEAGGLVALGGGISSSGSSADVEITSGTAGGLAAESASVFTSYAVGNVLSGDNSQVGGLVGIAPSFMATSYSRGSVTAGANSDVGGFVGDKQQAVSVSYSTGSVTGSSGSLVGGFAGIDDYSCCNSSDYWDVDTSDTNQGTGSGNEANVTGLTTVQFLSGLPPGFDASVWAEKKTINNGYPYLLANPPQ